MTPECTPGPPGHAHERVVDVNADDGVEHPMTTLRGAAVQRQRVVRRQEMPKTRH